MAVLILEDILVINIEGGQIRFIWRYTPMSPKLST